MVIQPWIEFGRGVLTGGLSLSACWGLFWLMIGIAGAIRGTCGRRVFLNGLAAFVIPLLLMAALAWSQDSIHEIGLAFAAGLGVMPLVLVGFGLRRTPDGRRAVAHLLIGVRNLIRQLLGNHQACGECDTHGTGAGGCG